MEIVEKVSHRREFIKGSLVSILAAGCFGGLALEELLAAAPRSGRPPLTAQGFSARIPSPQRKDAFRSELEAIKRDLVRYVDNHFDLSQEQLVAFKKIPKEDVIALNRALVEAEEKGRKVIVQSDLTPFDCQKGSAFRLRTVVDGQSLIVRATQR